MTCCSEGNNAPLTGENFVGGVGNDFIDGRGGFDRAVYSIDAAVAAGISVNLAAGIVTRRCADRHRYAAVG